MGLSDLRDVAGSSVLRDSPSAARLRAAALLCLVPAGCYYAFLLSASGGFFGALPHGLTFNSMLLHLLGGRFDVDPAAIGDEGFVHGGAVYAYFGIFPALLRAPLLGLRDFGSIDFTRLSCLAAVLVSAWIKVEAVLLAGRRAETGQTAALIGLMVAVVLIGGPQIEFLRPSIFQETMFWASACAAAFVYLFLRGWLGESGFTGGILTGMALVAGFCLLTRVSTALGLYVALGLLWARLLWQSLHRGMLRRELGKFASPAAVVCVFAAATGLVNQERWGNPLVFLDLTQQIIAHTRFPDRLARLREYGEFNPERIGYALQYYFFPVWVLRDGAGNLLWAGFQQRLFDLVELPPASFFVSDPLLIGLCVYGAVTTLRLRGRQRELVLLVGSGLAVPIVLMLTAIALAYRYRMEFYPLLELGAFIGFARLVAAPPRLGPRVVAAGTVVSCLTAHLAWLLYMLSPFGPAQAVMNGLPLGAFYRSLFQ